MATVGFKGLKRIESILQVKYMDCFFSVCEWTRSSLENFLCLIVAFKN